MIKLHFKTLFGICNTIEVNKSDIIYKSINQYVESNPYIKSILLKINNNYLFFGYDIKLNKKFEDYDFFNESNYTLWITTDHNGTKYCIHHPILYYKNNKEWPPSDNWNEGDPINLGPFLIWDGWGNGSLTVKNNLDNTYKNLVILKYGNVKKVVNKFSYMLAIMSSPTKSKDPLTNQLLKNKSLLKLYSDFWKKNKNHELLSEIELDFLEVPTNTTK